MDREIGDRTGLQETRQALSYLKPCATCMLVGEGTVLLDDDTQVSTPPVGASSGEGSLLPDDGESTW
jgi:hypothetical protein